MRLPRLLACTVAAAVIGGCSLTRGPPAETRLYAIEPAPGPAPAARRDDTLRFGTARVAASFSGTELVYRVDEVRYVNDFYNRLTAPPAGMLASRSADWLNRHGPFRFVAQPGTTTPTRYVIDVVFTEMYGDFRAGQAPAAVMAAQFQVIDLSQPLARVAIERSYVQRVALARVDPGDLVLAYGTALGAMLGALNADLAQLPR
jgi:uncharacterized lipoprotein YmbA